MATALRRNWAWLSATAAWSPVQILRIRCAAASEAGSGSLIAAANASVAAGEVIHRAKDKSIGAKLTHNTALGTITTQLPGYRLRPNPGIT